MPQPVQCDHCHKRFAAADHLAGRKVACPACRRPLHIPEAPLADLLDDVIQLREEEEVITAKVAQPTGPTCARCQDELIPGERYCVACGYHNFNGAEMVATSKVQQIAEREREAEKARRMRLLLRPNVFGLIRYWAEK